MQRPVVLITGAGIGIGAAMARAFARAGYRSIVTDVLEDEGESVATSIRSGSGEAEFHRLDVTDTGAVEALVSEIQERHGPLHTVVANAGIVCRNPLQELTDETWDELLDVDLKGVM